MIELVIEAHEMSKPKDIKAVIADEHMEDKERGIVVAGSGFVGKKVIVATPYDLSHTVTEPISIPYKNPYDKMSEELKMVITKAMPSEFKSGKENRRERRKNQRKKK